MPTLSPTRHLVSAYLLLLLLIVIDCGKAAAQSNAVRTRYEGTIGKASVRMTLQPKGDVVIGTYQYTKVGKDLEVQGTLHGKDSIILKEFDEREQQTGLFKGRYAGSATKIESIVGIWSRPDGSRPTPFTLRSTGSTSQPSTAEAATGRYKRSGKHGAEINVQHIGNNILRIEGEAFWVGQNDNIHTGDIGGTCKLEGIVAMYADTTMPDCRLQLTFGNAVLSVFGDEGNCGGMNVTFNGRYQRISTKPQFRNESK